MSLLNERWNGMRRAVTGRLRPQPLTGEIIILERRAGLDRRTAIRRPAPTRPPYRLHRAERRHRMRRHAAPDGTPLHIRFVPLQAHALRPCIRARNRAAQPGRAYCRPRATTSASASTSRVTTDPAPTIAPSPIMTGATSALFDPTNAPAPTTVRALLYPS